MRDTTVPPIERQPFTSTDEVGLEPFNLSVELPWTGNQLSRDPAEAAATSRLLEMETLSTDAFDRVVFRFSGDAPFPGYQARLVEDATEVSCAGSPATLEGGPHLVVTLRPVAPAGESGASGGVRSLGQPLFQDAGVACSEGGVLTWVARVAEGRQLRALELRDPRRLVVDLR